MLGLEWTWMLWFVDADSATAGKREGGKYSPPLFAHIRDLHLFRFEFFQGRGDVIAHQEKLMLVVLFGIVEGGFELRHGKNQPAVTGIHRRKFEYVAKEGPV